jgi:hypothetical protein
MSLKLRDDNNKFIMDFNETNKSIIVNEFEPTTFNTKDGEYNYGLTASYEYMYNGLNGQPIYGSWYDDANQSAPIAGTATHMLCGHGSGNGITKVANKDFQVQYSGVYNIQFSVQLDQSSGTGHHIFIWFRKNDIDIPYSASEVAIQGSLAEAIPSWNFIVDMVVGDHINIMYSVTDTRVYLKAVAPNTIPGIPSVIVTMWKL